MKGKKERKRKKDEGREEIKEGSKMKKKDGEGEKKIREGMK